MSGFFYVRIMALTGQERRTIPMKPEVIAYRKKCQTNGIGLSHYILMDPKTSK